MSSRELRRLRELAEANVKEVNAEKALMSLISAGILKEDGEHEEEYEMLERVTSSKEENV